MSYWILYQRKDDMHYESYDDYLEAQDALATIWICDNCDSQYDIEPPELECRCMLGRYHEVPKEG